MTRAQQTAEIIANEIGTIPVAVDNFLIEEGQPIPPEPSGIDNTEQWVLL